MKGCLGVVLISSVTSYDNHQSAQVDKTPRKVINGTGIPFGGFVFKQIRGVQSEGSPFPSCFQVPTAQYIKRAHVGQQVLNSYTHILTGIFCYPLLAGS